MDDDLATGRRPAGIGSATGADFSWQAGHPRSSSSIRSSTAVLARVENFRANSARALPDGWSLGLTAEVDALENAAGHGRHGAGSLTLGLSRGVGGGVNLGAEIWGGWDFDPSGHGRQRSFDLSAAWIPLKDANLQLDGGVNLGLDRQTPQAQIYAGVSRRF